jgi:enoyl-CoA hydratase/carnithine racemase
MTAAESQAIEAPVLLRDDADSVATLTLNRPGRRNALSRELMGAIEAALDDIAEDRTVRAVVLAANGPVFSSGHDLKELRAASDRGAIAAIFGQCTRMMLALVGLPQPVIARVHGIATAAGCQLVATCDLAIAAQGATFATPGVDIGLFCSTPMVALSRNVGRKQAMEMLLTSRPIDAETAVRFGLVNHAVPAAELDSAVAELARTITAKPARIVAMGKPAFYRQAELGLEAAYAYAGEVMIENMLAADAAEGIDAFLQKRPAIWKDIR